MSHYLRPYQVKGEADIFQKWKDSKKSIMFQLVTGGGKTVLFVNIIKKFLRAGKRVVLVAHREELIKQAWDTLYKNEIMAGIIKSGIPENFHMPCQVASIQTICRRSKLPKADLVIFDECFVPGTKIDGVDIERVRVGDTVNCYDEGTNSFTRSRVTRLFKNKYTSDLYEIHVDGRSIVCTAGHPILTLRGWIAASQVLLTDNLLTYDLQSLRRTNKARKENMLEKMFNERHFAADDQNKFKALLWEDDVKQSNEPRGSSQENDSVNEGQAVQSEGREWKDLPFPSVVNLWDTVAVKPSDGVYPAHQDVEPLPSPLQNRYSNTFHWPSDRGRRYESQLIEGKSGGSEKGGVPNWHRVESVTIHKRGGNEWARQMRGENFVYNLEVEKFHTYIANGVVVHNCHHSQDDNSYGDVLLKHWPYARVLGVTATPYRLGGKGFTSLFDTLVQGPPFKQIVEGGFLVPFKYFVSYNPDLSKAKVQRGDYVNEDISKAMQLAPIVESYLEHCEGKSGICFAVNIHHSNLIVRQYIERGIPAAHVDANTDITVRRKMFQDLRDKKILVLVNVGIATEGTDIPNIDFVQLARPTKSLALFLQMVGRVTRPLWESIKHGNNDEERRALIAGSDKPYGIVLDNAGLYLEHGLPDQEFDWHGHFIGYDKREKKKPDLIEIIEFVAEDEEGNIFKSRLPKEVEGLKLIEVNYIEKQKIINLTSLKEFDKKLEIFKRLPKINKVGFVAYRDYFDYCKKHSLMMSEEVWSYLNKRLVQDPAQERIKLSKDFERDCQIIVDNNERHIAGAMIAQAKTLHESRIAKIERVSVPATFLRAERERYYQENKTPVSA